MPFTATETQEANLLDLLHRHGGLEYLKVRRHGASLVLYSLQGDEKVNEARFTAVSRTQWRLDMPLHTGRWQSTPYVGSLTEVVNILITELSPFVAPWLE